MIRDYMELTGASASLARSIFMYLCAREDASYTPAVSARGEAEPTDLDIARVLTEFVPLSKTMAEQITALRTWAKGRARFATSPAEERKLRKLAA